MKYLAILGAPDHEMEAIEKLLHACGVHVTYATHGGRRVHSSNAYKADCPPELEGGTGEQWGAVLRVECAWPDSSTEPLAVTVDVADHHFPGDPGYGRPPSEFMAASSLGQVIAWLARRSLIPDVWVHSPHAWRLKGVGQIGIEHPSHPDAPNRYVVATAVTAPDAVAISVIPLDLVYTAAADHCLRAAYRDECLGVDPDELLRWRIASRARYQHRVDSERDAAKGDVTHYESLLRDRIEAAREILHAAPRLVLSSDVTVEDMRRDTPVDELAEAAACDDMWYVAGPFVGPDGRRRITCSGSAEVVRAFLDVWAPQNNIVDTYGDPARGFAVGYEK